MTRTADTAPRFRRGKLDLKLGERVYECCDPRHIGTVEAISHSTLAKVRWEKSGWYSWAKVEDLRFASKEHTT